MCLKNEHSFVRKPVVLSEAMCTLLTFFLEVSPLYVPLLAKLDARLEIRIARKSKFGLHRITVLKQNQSKLFEEFEARIFFTLVLLKLI